MIIFINNNYIIKNITNFCQYIMQLGTSDDNSNLKLITLIGEYHNIEFDCENVKDAKKIIDVSDYILSKPKNIKKKVILEFDRYSIKDIKKEIKSSNINTILDKILNSPVEVTKNINVVPIDFRNQYLDPIMYHKLYNDILTVSKLNRDELIFYYIKPFFEKIGEQSKFLEGEKYFKNVDILFKDYLPKIDKQFNKIFKEVEFWDRMSYDDKLKIIIQIRKAWYKLSDYYVIREIFKDDGTDEYIILIGSLHYENIKSYINDVLSLPDKMDKVIHFNKIVESNIEVKPFVNKYNCIETKNTLVYVPNEDSEKYKSFRKPFYQMFKF